jgi:hypothetical protein
MRRMVLGGEELLGASAGVRAGPVVGLGAHRASGSAADNWGVCEGSWRTGSGEAAGAFGAMATQQAAGAACSDPAAAS